MRTAAPPPPSPAVAAVRSALPADIRDWLETFAACVRDVDYDRARDMFDENVVGFGTFAGMLVGRKNLINGQWKNIWGCTRGFRFLLDAAHVDVSNDGAMAFVATPWRSQGRDAGGHWFDRLGRCTLVLRKVDGHWLCVHSHYSRQPAPAVVGGGATPA